MAAAAVTTAIMATAAMTAAAVTSAVRFLALFKPWWGDCCRDCRQLKAWCDLYDCF